MRYRVPRAIEDNFGAPIRELLHLINMINNPGNDQTLIIDFSDCQFANPFHLGTIAMLLCKSNNGKLPVTIFLEGLNNEAINSYFNVIYFPSCFNASIIDNTLTDEFDKYAAKTYIPIVKFPANSYGQNAAIREKLLEVTGVIIKKQLGLFGDFLNAIKYFISEMTNNVADHSGGDAGYIFAQFYPQKLYIDMCIIDDGNGIYSSFMNSERYHPASHVDAMEKAVNGYSTKIGFYP